MTQLNELLDQLEMYDFKAGNVTLTDSVVFRKLREMGDEMEAVLAPVGASRLVAERQVADPRTPQDARDQLARSLTIPVPGTKPTMAQASTILSVLYDVPGHTEPLVVGWTTCGACMMHIRVCKCSGGPEEPASVRQWRDRSGHVPAKPLPPLPTAVRIPSEPSAYADPPPAPVVTEAALPAQDSDLTASAVQDADTGGEGSEAVCKVCGIAATTENADRNDDGTWTCFADQAQSAERT